MDSLLWGTLYYLIFSAFGINFSHRTDKYSGNPLQASYQSFRAILAEILIRVQFDEIPIFPYRSIDCFDPTHPTYPTFTNIDLYGINKSFLIQKLAIF